MKHEPMTVVRNCLAQAEVQSGLSARQIRRIRGRLRACGHTGARIAGIPQVMTAVECRQNLRRALFSAEASLRHQERIFEQVQVHEALLGLDDT